MRLLVLAMLAAMWGSVASAQNYNPAGYWNCTVNARSNDPAGNYGIEVETQVQANGTLAGRGAVYNPNLQNSVQPFQGNGDWTLLPPDASNNAYLFKFRVHTNTHGIVVWYASPNGPGRLYNVFNGPGVQVETQCQKLG